MAAAPSRIEAGTEFDRYDDHAHGETAPLVAKIGLTRRTQLELQTPIVHSRARNRKPFTPALCTTSDTSDAPTSELARLG